MNNAIRSHAPIPGPMYWDWRCMRCSHRVAQHASVIARLRHRVAMARRIRKANA